jgi:hypothetical protein
LITPLEFDGITFDDATDFTDLARKAVLWKLGGSLPSDDDAMCWVERAYKAIEGTPWHDRFAEGMAACLADSDRIVRSQALSFFSQFPEARGGERIVELALGDRAGFAGVPGLTEQGGDLEWKLLHAVSARIAIGDTRAIELGKKEALAGRAEPIIASLTGADPQWVIEHAEQIVKSRPATGITILFNLERAGYNIADLGVRIANDIVRDPNFNDHFYRFIDDRQTKERILSAIADPWTSKSVSISDSSRYGEPGMQLSHATGRAGRCANCGSEQTSCIYYRSDRDLVGGRVVWEMECSKCGKFTSYVEKK